MEARASADSIHRTSSSGTRPRRTGVSATARAATTPRCSARIATRRTARLRPAAATSPFTMRSRSGFSSTARRHDKGSRAAPAATRSATACSATRHWDGASARTGPGSTRAACRARTIRRAGTVTWGALRARLGRPPTVHREGFPHDVRESSAQTELRRSHTLRHRGHHVRHQRSNPPTGGDGASVRTRAMRPSFWRRSPC